MLQRWVFGCPQHPQLRGWGRYLVCAVPQSSPLFPMACGQLDLPHCLNCLLRGARQRRRCRHPPTWDQLTLLGFSSQTSFSSFSAQLRMKLVASRPNNSPIPRVSIQEPREEHPTNAAGVCDDRCAARTAVAAAGHSRR